MIRFLKRMFTFGLLSEPKPKQTFWFKHLGAAWEDWSCYAVAESPSAALRILKERLPRDDRSRVEWDLRPLVHFATSTGMGSLQFTGLN